MHVHIGALEAVVLILYLIIIGAGWRTLSAYLATQDGTRKAFGEAMAFIY